MASQWGSDAVSMDSEIGQWSPPIMADGNSHSFAMTRTSFSCAGTSWANCGHSTTTTSSSGSTWPIASVGNWSNSESRHWGSPKAEATGVNQWSNTSAGPNTGAGDWANTSSLSRDAPEESIEWPSGPPINRWQDPDVNTTVEIQDEGEEEMMEDDNQKGSRNDVMYASPISLNEYDKQCKEYTKQAVAQLIASPEYQKKHTTCELCWCVWAHGQTRDSCPECGGYAMERPCALCDGRCSAVWTRDVDLSHSQHLAHWDGECKLPWKQRQGFLAQKLLESDEPVTDEQLVEDFSELKSS